MSSSSTVSIDIFFSYIWAILSCFFACFVFYKTRHFKTFNVITLEIWAPPTRFCFCWCLFSDFLWLIIISLYSLSYKAIEVYSQSSAQLVIAQWFYQMPWINSSTTLLRCSCIVTQLQSSFSLKLCLGLSLLLVQSSRLARRERLGPSQMFLGMHTALYMSTAF